MNSRWLVGSLFLLPGCVFGNRDVSLGPVAPATEERLATMQAIAIHVTDARDPEQRLVVGHPKNADGITTADVVPDKDPARWLEECLAEELDRAGFHVVATAPLTVRVDLTSCDAESYVSYDAEIAADLQMSRGEVELLPKTRYVGKAHGGMNVTASASSFQDVLHAAMRNLLASAVPPIVAAAEKGATP